ncbi:MAG: hypothetical protein GY715_20995 [Planctomycetes bacterium]|nr:hypothetical protein [Planctomycetota bacterium]
MLRTLATCGVIGFLCITVPARAATDAHGEPIVNEAPGLPGWTPADVDALAEAIEDRRRCRDELRADGGPAHVLAEIEHELGNLLGQARVRRLSIEARPEETSGVVGQAIADYVAFAAALAGTPSRADGSGCYDVSTFAQGMTILTGSTEIWAGASGPFVNEQADVPIGFDFVYYECEDTDVNTEVRVSTNGYLTFYQQGGGALDGIDPTNNVITAFVDPDGYVAPWWDNLAVLDQGTQDRVRSKTEGSVGSRVFTVEWRSVSRGGVPNDDAHNFQVKLFEADGSIELHYGGWVADPADTATVGLENYSGNEGACGPNCDNMNDARPPNNYRFTLPAPTGACCQLFNFCSIETVTDCATLGGVYEGDGTTCTPNPCPVAEIAVVKSADVSSLCEGVSTPVTYTYTVTNPGSFDLTITSVSDDVCGAASFVGGDTDMDGELDTTETWIYECMDVISATTVNEVTVTAHEVSEPQWMVFATDMLTITADPPPPCVITGPSAVCETATGTVYQSVGAASYAWSIVGQGTIVGPTDQQFVTVDATDSGSYTLTVFVSDLVGCQSMCDLVVSVDSEPACGIAGPTSMCDGATETYINFVNDIGWTYAWQVISGGGTIVGPNDAASVDVTGTSSFELQLTLTDGACVSVCTLPVTVNAAPTCGFPSLPFPVCNSTGNLLSANVFSGTPPYAYEWTVTASGSWQITAGATTGTITYTAGSGGSATFELTVTDANGCAAMCSVLAMCAESGACCLPGDVCSMETTASCATMLGTYLGDGSTCGTKTCPAAGQVQGEQKITEMLGGFMGDLDANDLFGASVASIGDLDDDGIEDLAVGAPGDDDGGTNRGAVWILFMNADRTVKAEQKISDTIGGFGGALANGDRFGRSVAGLGDFDGDGVEDLAVGVPFSVGGFGSFWILMLDTDGTVLGEFQQLALIPLEEYGASLANVGDLDGNGFPDLAVGAPAAMAGQGAVWVTRLAAGPSVVNSTRVTQGQGGFAGPLDGMGRFGAAVAGLGDSDFDGVRELAVGEPDAVTGTGAIWVLSITSTGTVTGELKIAEGGVGGFGGPTTGELFGSAIAPVRDLDGNGVDDLAVGAPGRAPDGGLWLLFMAADSTVLAERSFGMGGLNPGQAGAALGSALASVPDLDGNGLDEIAAAAPGDDDSGQDAGELYIAELTGVARVVLGPPSEFEAAGPGVAVEAAVMDDPGVSPAGGAGTTDVIIVVPNDVPTSPGDIQVFIAEIETGAGFAGFKVERPTYQVGVGPTDLTVADFNGDGYNDVAVTNGGGDSITIYFNDADDTGGLTLSEEFTITAFDVPTSIVAGEFINSEGSGIDIAITNNGNDTIVILENDGMGEFSAATAIVETDLDFGSFQSDVRDLDDDRDLDLISANIDGPSITVLQSNGDGTFESFDVEVGLQPFDVTTGDFNQCGFADAATADNGAGTISVARNDTAPGGSANFAAGAPFDVADNPIALDAGDLNADGFPDVAVIADDGEAAGRIVYVLTNSSAFGEDCGIAFTTADMHDPLADPNDVELADFNNDGLMDVSTVNTESGATGGSVTVFLSVVEEACIEDLNGNGSVDFADILQVIGGWGACDPPPEECPLDLNGNGQVDFADILVVIGSFGPCP